MQILILGGTREGRVLAARLAGLGDITAVLSLAGVTRRPATSGTRVRTGGFGGAAEFARFLQEEKIALVVDATHPFARRITATAHRVCRETGTPYLRLERPAWKPGPGDRWYAFETLDAALARVASLCRRPFATLARAELAALARVPACRFLVRTIEPAAEVPPNAVAITARPPFTLEAELALFRRFQVDGLLCRNSGGEGGAAKLEAARRLRLPMLVVEPPRLQVTPAVATVEEAYAFVRAFALGRSR